MRSFILLLLAASLLGPARAQPIVGAAGGTPWKHTPSVVVLIGRGDDRIDLVHAAVAFWNKTFAEIGSSFRFGQITHMYGAVPAGELADMSEKVRSRTGPPRFTPNIRRWPGNVVVALSSGRFVSFTARWPEHEKALVGVRNLGGPLAQSNVARNVIAHELGHAIGLPHNGDAETLMCGRPAPCRPDAFRSEKPRYFPLSAADKTELLRLYPADWKSR
jgi:hypothetical protein